jgi:hypothetical protein
VPDLLLVLTEELAVVDNLAGQHLADRLRGPVDARRVREARSRGSPSFGASCACR